MGQFLSNIYIHIVDDNYFNGLLIKKMIIDNRMQRSSISILSSYQLEETLKEYQTDVNDIFLFSTDLERNKCFDLAGSLRESCKKCQIGFYGYNASNLNINQINFISSIGVVDINKEHARKQIGKMLIEATTIKKEIMQDKTLLRISNKKEVFFFDADNVTFITTIKGERNRIEIHQSKSVDYIHTAIKEVKKMNLPEYFMVFKFYIININQIKKISKTNDKVFFYNGEYLEIGKRISSGILQNI